MNTKTLRASIASCLLIAAISGCDKDSNKPIADDTKKAAEGAADSVKQAADKAATEVKQAGDKIADAVAKPAEPASAQADGVIAKAKSLVTEKKYSEALTALAGLKDIKLTDAQQKIVDELKAQIQKLMSGDAGKAAGNLLGK